MQSVAKFRRKINVVKIFDYEVMLLFDVTSLPMSMPKENGLRHHKSIYGTNDFRRAESTHCCRHDAVARPISANLFLIRRVNI